MDRRKDAGGGFDGLGFGVIRVLPVAMLLVLMGFLAVLLGCQQQFNPLLHRLANQIRPPANTTRLLQNAEYLRKSGRLELAVEELEEARVQEPDNLKILDVLARCYDELGDFTRSQELYEEALSRAGYHPALENNRGFSLYLRGRLDQAEACFRQLLTRQPDNQTARNNLGLVLCRQGREAEALALWQEALSDANARQRLGEALTALGREVPSIIAAVDPPSGDQRTKNPSSLATYSVSEPSRTWATLPEGNDKPAFSQARSAPLSSPPTASQDWNLTPAPSAGQSPTDTQRKLAAQASAPPALSDQLTETKQNHLPEPATALSPDTQTQPQIEEILSESSKKQSDVAAGASTVESTLDPTPISAGLESTEAEIELGNDSGIENFALSLKRCLALEGFSLVSIKNHNDFGLVTIVAHRHEPARVDPMDPLWALQFFPGAKLEAEDKTSIGTRDLAGEEEPTHQSPENVTAKESAPPPPTAPVTEAAETPLMAPTPLTNIAEGFADQAPHQMRIELRNGNGVSGQAHKMRKLLRSEGFKVINIGNNKDYDIKETTITYRPEAAGVAKVLSQKFFLGANLVEGNLPLWLDIRILMGHDLNAPRFLAQMSQ